MPSRSQKYIKNWNNICSPSRKALIKAYLSLLSTKTFYHGGASARERYREKGWVKFLHLCRPSFIRGEEAPCAVQTTVFLKMSRPKLS